MIFTIPRGFLSSSTCVVLYATPHVRRVTCSLVPVLVGCCLLLAIRCCDQIPENINFRFAPFFANSGFLYLSNNVITRWFWETVTVSLPSNPQGNQYVGLLAVTQWLALLRLTGVPQWTPRCTHPSLSLSLWERVLQCRYKSHPV